MSVNTVYQAATDGFVTFHCGGAGGYAITNAQGYTDSSNPPTRKRAECAGDEGPDTYPSGCMPVRKGDYWRVYSNTSSYIYNIDWLPLGY